MTKKDSSCVHSDSADVVIGIIVSLCVYSSQACLPYLKEGKNPHILNISPPLNMSAKWFKNHVGKFIYRICLHRLYLDSRLCLQMGIININHKTVFFCFFFWCVPQLYLWGSPLWVRFLRMWRFFNPTIKVVTFRLHGWCWLGVFFVSGIHPSRTWTSGSFESVRWNACMHRLDLGLYSHPKEFWGEWSLNPC